MNLRRDKPSPDALDELFEIMAAIMPVGFLPRKTFFGTSFDAPGWKGHPALIEAPVQILILILILISIVFVKAD
jgi:hypothetical protein